MDRGPIARARVSIGFGNIGKLELDRRHIDRQAQMAGPGRRFTAGRLEDPSAEFDDETGLLGGRDEIGRRDDAEAGIGPAAQGLRADDAAALEVDLEADKAG